MHSSEVSIEFHDVILFYTRFTRFIQAIYLYTNLGKGPSPYNTVMLRLYY